MIKKKKNKKKSKKESKDLKIVKAKKVKKKILMVDEKWEINYWQKATIFFIRATNDSQVLNRS